MTPTLCHPLHTTQSISHTRHRGMCANAKVISITIQHYNAMSEFNVADSLQVPCSRAWMCLARHRSTGSILAGCPSCHHQWLICVPAGTEPRPLGASLLTLPLSHGNSLQSYNATKHVYTRGSQNIGCVFLWTRYRVELCCINRTYWRCTCCIQLVDRHVSIKYT